MFAQLFMNVSNLNAERPSAYAPVSQDLNSHRLTAAVPRTLRFAQDLNDSRCPAVRREIRPESRQAPLSGLRASLTVNRVRGNDTGSTNLWVRTSISGSAQFFSETCNLDERVSLRTRRTKGLKTITKVDRRPASIKKGSYGGWLPA